MSVILWTWWWCGESEEWERTPVDIVFQVSVALVSGVVRGNKKRMPWMLKTCEIDSEVVANLLSMP